ncbi:hypothetical protein CEP54_016421, partial [Fusarium duplospermum]
MSIDIHISLTLRVQAKDHSLQFVSGPAQTHRRHEVPFGAKRPSPSKDAFSHTVRDDYVRLK